MIGPIRTLATTSKTETRRSLKRAGEKVTFRFSVMAASARFANAFLKLFSSMDYHGLGRGAGVGRTRGVG